MADNGDEQRHSNPAHKKQTDKDQQPINLMDSDHQYHGRQETSSVHGSVSKKRKPKVRRITDLINDLASTTPSNLRGDTDDDPERLKTEAAMVQEPAPPVFHHTILEEIGNHEAQPVFLFEKEIKRSDLDRSLCRLRITPKKKDKLLGFLRQEERIKVEEDMKNGLTVIAREAQSGGDQYTMHLTKDKDEDDILVLKHEWRKLVLKHKLKFLDLVQAWGYRLGGGDEFRLALNFISKTQHH